MLGSIQSSILTDQKHQTSVWIKDDLVMCFWEKKKSENEIREVLVVLHMASMQSLLKAIKICNYICMDYTNP